ncbi:HPr kinase/phosphorylase [Ruegeria arenilitoris]|uniref:HPr kinase/phosphorylase n=1 Tax=Ruegeria arenilitoris TaxID=1173585 RepID=UPI001479DA18|nr:HPr kinase/phosphatase C-terminal domain-containing protein [Ruegeria arenilitoris]
MSGRTLLDIQKQDAAILHATCVAVEGRGALILGRSGAGKSALALQMLALGAELVGDDRVALRMVGERAMAAAAPNLRGLIEARGIGLLRAQTVGATPVCYVVDLDQSEPERLPEPITAVVLRQTVPLLRAADTPNLAAALVQLLKIGRVDPEWPNT